MNQRNRQPSIHDRCTEHPQAVPRPHVLGDGEYHLWELACSAPGCRETLRWELHAPPHSRPPGAPIRGAGPCRHGPVIRRAVAHANRDDLRVARSGNGGMAAAAIVAGAIAGSLGIGLFLVALLLSLATVSALMSADSHRRLTGSPDPDESAP